MDLWHFALVLLVFLVSNSSLIQSQQPYIRKNNTRCSSSDDSSSVLGYTCNGAATSCQAYLTFRSLPPFNSVSSISTLLAADPSQLSRLNSASPDAIFETNKVVLVPVNCSCSGPYYQFNTSYTVKSADTPLKVANNTYQGLSTCQALAAQNANLSNMSSGMRINVPLRCACPTKNQTDDGVKYLLSYLVTWGEYVSLISQMFGVDTETTLLANGLSDQDFTIYPFTTLLVPLRNIPSSSQIVDTPPTPSQQSPPYSITPTPNGSSSNKTWVYAVVGTLGGISLISVSVLLVYCFCFRKRKIEKDSVIVSESFESVEKQLAEKLDEDVSSESFWNILSSVAQSLTIYKYEELKLATDNFSSSCLIGGSVYRGAIKGDFAAIKKVSGDVSEQINLLNKINHLNLIRLSGVCFYDGYWYLVFEYAAKGALSDWIYGKDVKEKKFLNWMQRIQIAFDVASGLNYLHSYTSPPHVHKDLKCSNVLLDADFRAKITNFSQTRSADAHGGQFALTRHIMGTKGYMAPEYLENGLVSPKLDVYSFGVLLMEILTGKETSVNLHLGKSLVSVLDEKNGDEILSDFMDPSLEGNYPSELAILLIRLIDSCLKKDPSARPGMHEIVQTLSTTMNATMSRESNLSV